MKIRRMLTEEQKYAYPQSQQLAMQCGSTGYMHDDYVKEMNQFLYGIDGENSNVFGIRVDIEKYTYLIRCNPREGDYGSQVYCYKTELFEHHIEQAAKGILFINSHYKELFRIPDSSKIVIIYPDGKSLVKTCRYINETHVEVGNELFHICEFAERMEQSGCSYTPAS